VPSTKNPPHLVTLVLTASVGALSMNVFLPALPAIAKHFQTDYAYAQLMVSLYLASVAIMQLFIGPASDRLGRRPVLIGCFGFFLLATLAAMYAPTIQLLLVARVLQGTAAAGIVLSRAIVRDMYGPADAASMMGYVAMGMALVPMIAPTIGGVLAELYGWEATFVLVIFHGAFTLVLVWFNLGETNKTRSSSFTAQFKSYPELIGARSFWGYTLATALTACSFFAFLGGGPFVASDILGMSPARYGLYFGLLSLGYMVGNFLAGRFSSSQGLMRMIRIGTLTSSAGVAGGVVFDLMGVLTPLSLFIPAAFVGIGNGISQPNSNTGMVSVRPHLAGSASGLGGAIQMGTAALAAFIASALLEPDGTALPLFAVMLTCSVLAFFSTFLVAPERKGSD